MLKTLIKDKIELSHKSIINELRGYRNRPEDAICEYIWNSFDAQSTTVNINYDFINGTESAVAFGYPSLSVSDNGTGWDLSNTQTAKLFLDSQKSLHKNRFKSIPHGSKGVGRFTFYCFASKAIWESHFNGQSYQLTLERESLASYEIDSSKLGPTDQNGTTVRFEVDNTLLNESFFEDVLPARLLEKFAWFLIEHPEKQININGNPLDLNSIIKNRKEESLIIDGKTVLLDLVQWNRSLADQENSRAYYIGNDSEEICKYPTGLNNKADDFYHSAFVRSASFDTVLFD
ncbi:MAG TPA: ATP-binding protein, partial [Patescibacteria group bacterium]